MDAILTSILLMCAAWLTLAWFVAAQRRLVADAARRFVALPRLRQVVLVLAICVMTVCAQKQRTENSEQLTDVVAEASGSNFNAEILEKGRRGEEVATQTMTDSASPSLDNLRVKAPQASASANPCESVKSVAITTNDLACGFALVEVRTNAAVSYAMPTNGIEVGTWGKTGAYQDVVRVCLSTDCTDYCGLGNGSVATDFHGFVWGDEVVTSLWAHTWGKVRPRLRDRAHEIVAVGTPMSVVAGEGRLWTAATTNGTFLLTWENFVVGRVRREIIATDCTDYHGLEEEVKSAANSQSVQFVKFVAQTNATISAQIELSPNGDFITRSNEVEWVYRRINPDDWDDDGIANEEDDEPMVAAGETQFGPQQTLPDGANSNAYCWVDLVVPQANAKVTFTGDGASNLADPTFIAKAGETYRVAILIGKTYRVTCPLPFRIAAKSSEEIEETWNGANEVELCWPVSVNSCVTDDDAESDAQCAAIRQISVVDASDYTLSPLMTLAATAAANATTPTTRSQSVVMSVVPSGLGGLFEWTKHCCSISGTSYAFEQTCRGKCDCSDCSTEGYFEYEGYRLPVCGPSCPCAGAPDDDDDSGAGDEDDDSPSRGVSAYFTKSVIFFEDEYDNSPTEHIGWCSTETVLKCSANGGEKGGLVKIEIEGADNLVQYNGETLPYMKLLEPNETVSFKNTYRAVEENNAAGDIKVKAMFVENETEWSQETTDEATAVKVMLEPLVFAPANECVNRHEFGIGEEIACMFKPQIASCEWMSTGAGTVENSGGRTIFKCPMRTERNGIKACGAGSEYTPQTHVVEPTGVSARDPSWRTVGVVPGDAGGILLTMTLHALPLEVSFEWIVIEEIPDVGGTHSGYFADSYFMSDWLHGEAQMAGKWHRVVGDNQFLADEAGIQRSLPQVDENGYVSSSGTNGWCAGVLSWNVPCGWAPSGVKQGDEPIGSFAMDAMQVMEIDSDGACTVRKHSNAVTRKRDGTVILNGETQE